MAHASREGLPPGPNTPALFVTLGYMKDAYKYYRTQYQKFGSPFTVRTLRGPLVIVTDPEQAKQVFTQNPDELDVWGADALDPIVGPTSLLLVAGNRHKRDRKLLTPPFHGARMKAYGAVMREAARREVARFRVGEEKSFLPSAQAISLEVILRAVFGVQTSSDVEAWSRAVTALMESAHPAGLFFRAARIAPFGLGPWAKFLAARAAVDKMIYNEIHDRRTSERYGEDILSLMLQARYEDGGVMSDADLRDELMTLLLAGHETTAISLSWALYWLHRHPSELADLRRELDQLTDDGRFEAEHIAQLPLLEAVCNETLRLHPIVVDVIRHVRAPIEIGGYKLPAGSNVAVSIATIHERDDVFERAAEFAPKRFLRKKFSPFEHMPFGGGHRRCLGAAFAMYEMKLVLAELLRDHTFEVVGSERVARRGITLGPAGGVRVRYLGPRVAKPSERPSSANAS
ncbi:MAG: cytochrome P450 [Myxococcales bacterium]|nr:cytochrome P450 [Myxococcales bacterium]